MNKQEKERLMNSEKLKKYFREGKLAEQKIFADYSEVLKDKEQEKETTLWNKTDEEDDNWQWYGDK